MAAKKLKFTEIDTHELIAVTLGNSEKELAALARRWPQKAGGVDELAIHNVLHLLTPTARVHVVNEAGRVLKSGGKLTITTPHWCAAKAYADPRVQWPPVVEGWFAYLGAASRAGLPGASAFTCDFEGGLGYGLHPQIVSRNFEYQQHAVTFWKEAAQDLCATFTRK